MLGGAFEHYPGSGTRQNRALIYPWLVYRGEVLRVVDNKVSARVFENRRLHVDVDFDGALSAPSSEIDARRGMEDLGYLLEAGPRIRYRFDDLARDDRVWLASLSLRGALSVNSRARTRGAVLSPSIDYRAVRALQGRLGYQVSADLRFASADYMNYYYRVGTNDATPTRRAYDARPGYLGARVSLFASWRASPDWTLFGFAQLAEYSGAVNTPSPLFASRHGYQAGIGVAMTLWRASTTVLRAPDLPY